MLSKKWRLIHRSTFTIPLITPMQMQIIAKTHKKLSVPELIGWLAKTLVPAAATTAECHIKLSHPKITTEAQLKWRASLMKVILFKTTEKVANVMKAKVAALTSVKKAIHQIMILSSFWLSANEPLKVASQAALSETVDSM